MEPRRTEQGVKIKMESPEEKRRTTRPWRLLARLYPRIMQV